LENYPQKTERDWLAVDSKSLRSTVTNSGDEQQNFVAIVSLFSHSTGWVVISSLQVKQARLQAKYPKAKIEVWSMDEHRLGLKSVQRRVWEQQAEQPIAAVKWRFQWLWLYGFVHPESGETKRVDSTTGQYRPFQQSFSR
jgi:hypothetical protein